MAVGVAGGIDNSARAIKIKLGWLACWLVFIALATAFWGSKQLFDFWFLPFKINYHKNQKAMCCLSGLACDGVGLFGFSP